MIFCPPKVEFFIQIVACLPSPKTTTWTVFDNDACADARAQKIYRSSSAISSQLSSLDSLCTLLQFCCCLAIT